MCAQMSSRAPGASMDSDAAGAARLRLYNTPARAVVSVDLDPKREVGIYTCGPTVYRSVHLGNLRSYLLADVLRRLLLAQGYRVRHVKNITDVGHMRQELLDRGEDKIVAEALSAGLTSGQIAARYTDEFLRDERCIGILPADVFPRATEHVPRMIEITQALLQSGHAYERGGNVYFRVASFARYGELGGSLSREGLRQGVRAEVDPLKDDLRDFALWKAAEPGRTELVWPSPWGPGFPGWHIECTAMSTQHLGTQVDIHTGGVDNIFPHHEDERAQSEAFTGVRPFARVWLHGQHLLADGVKMAKSTGNAYTLSDVQALDFEPLAFRYLCLTVHYRKRQNFTLSSLRAAQRGLCRLRAHVARWGPPAAQLSPEAKQLRDRFWSLAQDNLALPRCLALLWSLARATPRRDGRTLARATRRRLPETDHAAQSVHRAALPAEQKAALARDFDRLLGLDLGRPPEHRPADPFRGAISTPRSVPDLSQMQSSCDVSVIVLVQPDEDLAAVRRCLRSVLRHRHGLELEIVLVDATGSPEAHAALTETAGSDGQGRVRMVWVDHDPGAAAGRNVGLRASRGEVIVLLDASVELVGDVFGPLLAVLADPSVGAAGPFGLLTSDMRHFHELEAEPPAGEPRVVDALQNYLLALRRADLPRIGMLDEHYRFYRILDLDLSYTIRDHVGRVVTLGHLPLVRHRHALWEALSDGDREERSRKNFGRFLKRWDHRHDLPRYGLTTHADGPVAVHG
ncbi:MAG TPA: cysteine--tRNA ligase [Chloroflexota bacterium]|nr:cysteine--tRNA ligase [Chloroflexota bacterium]